MKVGAEDREAGEGWDPGYSVLDEDSAPFLVSGEEAGSAGFQQEAGSEY